ncbi:type III-B CRISPR module-associated protein Cmr3 [Arhodomonas sp. KWT]|uniref:type III-B CRISPR module-associated protein Cmr3 n=1 Tax=Arhodomonas sp. KWT TaxID=2679915 RepID=UPI0013D5707F|nr:type III-B CRISPR module-associated protein Cmr3 [Arhodomonas sp. KWT]
MTEYRFIQPLDVLHLRGNRLFGDGGGQGLMPPWPSVFAGALRSRMLVDAGVDPARYANGEHDDAPITEVLGAPDRPGPFTIESVTLARRDRDGVEPLRPVPADVEVFLEDEAAGPPEPHRLQPRALPPGVSASLPLEQAPLLRRDERGKPRGGYWLTASGWERYLRGEELAGGDLIHSGRLWETERRLGIELDHNRRSTVEGQLYTTDALRLCRQPETGFLVGVGGGGPLPAGGVLRLGGDGRGAGIATVEPPPEPTPDLAAIQATGRCRIVLTSPGIFPDGWRLPGLSADGLWTTNGLRARVTAASVPRGGVISGWDLANKRPKPAVRVAPAGSVYWLELLQGDTGALRKLAETGLWGLTPDNDDPMRRAEGFNRFAIANA